MKALQFNALVLEITERCNAKCAMCYQAAGPKGSDIRGDSNLPLDVALRVIEEAAGLLEIESRLHVSGGEAFIRYQDTMAMFRKGKSLGILNIGATTNGFWAVNRDTARRRCEELFDAGLTYLEISMDYWHLPWVSVDRIRNLLWAARCAGIGAILRTLTTKSHHMDELFADFEDADFLGVIIGNNRVSPVGRGCSDIPANDIYYGNTEGCCEDVLALTVTPNGNVYPCCAGADMTDALACGNVHNDTLAQALFKMRTDRTMRQLIHVGSGSLLPIIRELGYGDRIKDKYAHICHLCWDIFKDNELAEALRNHFAEQQFAEMIQMLQSTSPPVTSGDEVFPVRRCSTRPEAA
jgi:MoaA/NifB/PqqE/SkfB family radical SAM enzyme